MSKYRNLKNKEMELSYLQERMLDALYMLTVCDLRTRDSSMYFATVHFQGRALCGVIGGAWSTFRKKEMDKLIELGWVEKKSYTRLGWMYWLTLAGFSTLDTRVRYAGQHCFQAWYDDSEGQPSLFEIEAERLGDTEIII